VRLRRGGRASHLKPVTRDDLARRYGYFLDFLARSSRLDVDAEAGAQVIPAHVDAYVIELRERVGSVTLHGSVYKLRRFIQIIAPEHDVAWLREIENDLALAMKPRSKYDRLILAEVLVEAGLVLMTEADAATHRTPLQCAAQYRNGLMVALLACGPVRLKNFATLTLGASLLQVENNWWIVLGATETKEGRPDERRIPEFLAVCMERYLSHYRPVLGRSETPSKAFWLSSNDGKPMDYSGVERIVTATTAATVGVPVSPHLFRMAAATTAAIHARTMPHLASALLDHRDPVTTQQHYNRASSLSAGSEYLKIVESYRSEAHASGCSVVTTTKHYATPISSGS